MLQVERTLNGHDGASGLVRDFRDFIADYRARREVRDTIDKKRARLHYALLAGLISFVVGSMLWFMSWMTNFMENHHISDNQPKITLSQPNPDPTSANGKYQER